MYCCGGCRKHTGMCYSHDHDFSVGHVDDSVATMVTTMANELARTGKETALLGICAAGGLGAAAVLEAVN